MLEKWLHHIKVNAIKPKVWIFWVRTPFIENDVTQHTMFLTSSVFRSISIVSPCNCIELVISAPDSGSIEIGCPDMSYDISAECRTFNLDNDEEELFQIDPMTNEPLVGVPLITLEEQFGPIVVFEIDSGTTAYCRATCIEVGLP